MFSLWQFILSVFYNAKKRSNSVTRPENAQDSTIHYLYSHLKTTVKLHIAEVRGVGEYKTLNTYVSHFYCICSLQFYSKRKIHYSHLFRTNISNTLLVQLCTNVNKHNQWWQPGPPCGWTGSGTDTQTYTHTRRGSLQYLVSSLQGTR